MPPLGARLRLELVSVRVERLREITEADALAEGITWPDINGQPYRPPIDVYGMSNLRLAAKRYSELWDSIYSRRDGGQFAWDKNCWVFALTFKKL